MADSEQIEFLRQGASAWNEWRGHTPDLIPDLAQGALTGLDLSACDLSRANLVGADLSGSDLSGANLSDAQLTQARLADCLLENLIAQRAQMMGVDATGARFRRAELTGSDLNRAVLARSDLREVTLAGAQLSKANLAQANLDGAQLPVANLRGAVLSAARLDNASLHGANLSHTHLPMASMRSCDLTRAELVQSHLWKADLFEAVLTGANLEGAFLGSCNLKRANLALAQLNRADLTGADLSGADLQRVFLVDAGLTDADCSRVNLAGARLNGAELVRTNFGGAKLTGCDLSEALMIHAHLEDAEIADCWLDSIVLASPKDEGAKQGNLSLMPSNEAQLMVDDLSAVELVGPLMRRKGRPHLFEAGATRLVLVIGAFAESRRAELDSLRGALRSRNYFPVVLDLAKPAGDELRAAVENLATLSRFVLVDLNDAALYPELSYLRGILSDRPVRALMAESTETKRFSELSAYFSRPVFRYRDTEALVAEFDALVEPVSHSYGASGDSSSESSRH